MASCTVIHLAVAWASVGFTEYDALIKAKRKIGKAIVGTHFYQTAPEFIEKFSGNEHVRFIMNHSGVFHPKLYLFEHKRGDWACIVGSANFTVGGFGKNQEASMLVTNEDDATGAFIANANALIERCWNDAVPGNRIDLVRYREMQKRFSKPLAHAAGQFGKGNPGRVIEEVDILNMTWDEFLRNVSEDKHHSIDRRLMVLKEAQRLFRLHGSLEHMEPADRKGIGGFRNGDDIPWGWFGSMRGAGVFKNLINQSPRGISNALDQIPLDGQVTQEDYLEFVERFVQAFPLNKEGEPARHGLGTATRLLAMKRPDYFVCLDEANRTRLLDAFGVKMTSHDYEGYWDKVIERLKLAAWWNARRPPKSKDAGVWDGRVAMLDAIYYEPTA